MTIEQNIAAIYGGEVINPQYEREQRRQALLALEEKPPFNAAERDQHLKAVRKAEAEMEKTRARLEAELKKAQEAARKVREFLEALDEEHRAGQNWMAFITGGGGRVWKAAEPVRESNGRALEALWGQVRSERARFNSSEPPHFSTKAQAAHWDHGERLLDIERRLNDLALDTSPSSEFLRKVEDLRQEFVNLITKRVVQ